jgi:hypothetical protein
MVSSAQPQRSKAHTNGKGEVEMSSSEMNILIIEAAPLDDLNKM